MSVTVPSATADEVGVSDPPPLARRVGHLLAAAVVITGVAAQLFRPLAPDLGPAPPPDGTFDAVFLARAARYREPLYLVMAAAVVLRLGFAAAIAFTAPGRALVARLVRRVGEQRPARAAAVVVLVVVVATDLLVLPLAFWAGFVHDGAFGLRTQGLAGWAYDWLVFHVPVWLGVGVLALAGYALARRRPRDWPAIAGITAGVLGVVVAFASPLVLEPLSFQFTPLPEGPVRAEVERILAAAGEQIDTIVVADASRRSVRQNAYVSGLGTSRRVVLYDTLVDGRPADEVGIVMAHELAHHRNRDLPRKMLLAGAGTVIAAYAVWALVNRRTRRGAQRGAADPYAAAVVLFVVLALNVASIPLQSAISRRAEAAADLGSLEFTDAPEAFARMHAGLARANLAQPRPPRAVTLWSGSHPTVMARIGMARWWEQR
jgi:STE24 endopeptidase